MGNAKEAEWSEILSAIPSVSISSCQRVNQLFLFHRAYRTYLEYAFKIMLIVLDVYRLQQISYILFEDVLSWFIINTVFKINMLCHPNISLLFWIILRLWITKDNLRLGFSETLVLARKWIA